MKKTIVILASMCACAFGAELPTNYTLDLATPETVTYDGEEPLFITKTGDDTSPAWGEITLTFSLTETPTASGAHNLVNVRSSNIGTGQGQSVQYNAYGVYIDGSTLIFGRSHCTAADALTLVDNKVTITTNLTANTEYTLTLTSYGTGTPAGRGAENFSITLTDVQGNTITKTAAGFGLNGNECTGFILGDSDLKGTATFTAAPAPEPTTATLSLLALAGLAARRRRASR